MNQQKKGSILSNHFYSKGCCNSSSSFARQRELLCIFFAVLCSKLIAYCHELEFGFLYSRRALDMDGTLDVDCYIFITLMILSQTPINLCHLSRKGQFEVNHWQTSCRLKIKFILIRKILMWTFWDHKMSWSNKSIQRMFLRSSLTPPKVVIS